MSSSIPATTSRPGCLTYLLFVAASIWIVLVTYVGHSVAWLADQVLLIQGTPLPWFGWPLISWGHVLLLALPVVLLAFFTRAPRFRSAYQTWTRSLAFIAVLALARVFPVGATQPAALAQVVLSAIGIIALIWSARRRGRALGRANTLTTLFAVALVPIIVFPLFIWGALGSPLDTLLDGLAALGLGLFAGALLDLFLFQPLTAHASTPGRDIAFGGFVAGIALVLLGAGFGFGGSQLLLLLMLPPLGFAVAGLKRFAPRDTDGAWSPLAWFIGLCAAAPLVFVDPDELSLLLGNDEILTWAFKAAALSPALALLVAVALWLIRHRISGPPHVGIAGGAFAMTWIAALLLFVFAGRPGFYGEQLFVILREQADVSAAAQMADRTERIRFVYTTLTQQAARTQANLRATFNTLRIAYKPYYLVNGMEVNGGPLVRAYLLTQPEVERVLDSPHLRPLPAPVPISSGDQPAPMQPQWNITMIGADRVWKELGVTGKGIVVGQSDSGVDGNHPVLRDGYRGRNGRNDYNWMDPWNHSRAPTDIGGHGTHTLGSILGRDNVGVAPDAEWFACVNLARNLGNPPVYLDCMQFMFAPYPQDGDALTDGDPTRAAHVINDSWGCPPVEGCDANALEPAARALRAAGVFVVASAGNEGPRCGSVSDPLALYGSVFSVGAVDKTGTIAIFSSRGPVTVDGSNRVKPEIIAPGVDVLSSFPGKSYAIESGTSMAGPHVVGVVALMWSAQPKLIGNIERTTQILTQTAKPYRGGAQPPGGTIAGCVDDHVPSNVTGYGIVDAYAAVKMAMQGK